MEERVQRELALADRVSEETFPRELGSMDEAARLLDDGYEVIGRLAPNILRLVAAMATYSRMVSAMAPRHTLRRSDFKLPQLASATHLVRMFRRFLLSTTDRCRLAAHILRRSFALAFRFLWHSIAAPQDGVPLQPVPPESRARSRESLSVLAGAMQVHRPGKRR